MHHQKNGELTPHELAVSQLLYKGETVPTVARRLNLSVQLAKSYVKSIYKKLGVHNRVQFMWAFAEVQSRHRESS